MRKPSFLLLLVILVCIAFPASAADAGKKSWTGDPALDAAFVLNNQGKYAEAFAAFSALHARGVFMAGTMLGRYYEDGRSVPKDFAKARQYYEKAKASGEVFGAYHHARFTRGYSFLKEPGVDALMDEVEAEAERGNVPVQAVLASAYEMLSRSPAGPDWSPPNPLVRAKYWTQKGAEAGYAPCQFNMVEFDRVNAREWLRKAAESGYPRAVAQWERLQEREARMKERNERGGRP